MLKFIKEFFVGKRVEVSTYNASIMNKPTFKTIVSGSVITDFFEWSKQQRISSSCPKDVGLEYTPPIGRPIQPSNIPLVIVN